MSGYILVVDDDPLMRRSLAFILERAGYDVTTVGSAEAALERVDSSAPELLLMDLGLPGIDGLEALRRLQGHQFPVILITARRRELDEVLGLELGADDYVTKPFDPDVLLARIRSVLRRTRSRGGSGDGALPRLVVGDLVIDYLSRNATLAGQPLTLAPREFQLLYHLAREAGRVVPTETLLESVWGADYEGEPQVLYVHVRWLRQKLGDASEAPRRLLTVRGVGYKLVAPAD